MIAPYNTLKRLRSAVSVWLVTRIGIFWLFMEFLDKSSEFVTICGTFEGLSCNVHIYRFSCTYLLSN